MLLKANANALDAASLELLFFCFFRLTPRATIWIFGVAGIIFVDNMNSNFSNIVHRSAWYNLGRVS